MMLLSLLETAFTNTNTLMHSFLTLPIVPLITRILWRIDLSSAPRHVKPPLKCFKGAFRLSGCLRRAVGGLLCLSVACYWFNSLPAQRGDHGCPAQLYGRLWTQHHPEQQPLQGPPPHRHLLHPSSLQRRGVSNLSKPALMPNCFYSPKIIQVKLRKGYVLRLKFSVFQN